MTDDITVIFEDDDDPTDRRILRRLDHIIQALARSDQQGAQIMTQQDDINAAIATLQDTDNGLDAAVTAIQAEIATLQGQGIDTSGLNAAVAALQPHVAAVEAIANPAPVTEPAPFVAKIDGETYTDYVARAEAAGITPADEATWDALPVG